MPSFEYTHKTTTYESSVVDQIWYNQNTNVMYVSLHGTVYSYSDVPLHVFTAFKSAASTGSYYSNNVRGKFSSNAVGPANEVSAYLTALRVGAAENVTKKVQEPNLESQTRLTLAPPSTKPTRYEFGFTVDNGVDEKVYGVTAQDQDKASEALGDVADALGLTFNVKWVKIYL